jgi:hypothetical protein
MPDRDPAEVHSLRNASLHTTTWHEDLVRVCHYLSEGINMVQLVHPTLAAGTPVPLAAASSPPARRRRMTARCGCSTPWPSCGW